MMQVNKFIPKIILKLSFLIIAFFSTAGICTATKYYIHPEIGNDNNSGISIMHPIKTLAKVSSLKLYPGDEILLAAGYTFEGMLKLEKKSGDSKNPILIGSYQWANTHEESRAIIDASNSDHGIYLLDCSFIKVKDLIIQAGDADGGSQENLRCGVLVSSNSPGLYQGIMLFNLLVRNIFIEKKGFDRGKDEVRTANGVQRYGWGIRFLNRTKDAELMNLSVINCTIKNVAHTGIKFTSSGQHMYNIKVHNNRVIETGGPGIQISGGKFAQFSNNYVSGSGSNDDSRKWGRGSGLWTWGSADILIEKNHFMDANGPGDSAGCHIDFNCNDVVVQYNFSANNAGGFCEILGNNYNCAYRYNISVNDGHRIKGKNNAFQEGKTFWLSGYVGKQQKRSGPFNSYFYNNTIYTNKDIVSKIAVSKVADGVLIANNIFYVEGVSKAVMGDQYVPEKGGSAEVKNIFFKNNLYLDKNNWPKEVWIQDENKIIGNPDFVTNGGLKIEDYIPKNNLLIQDKGIEIPFLKGDSIGLKIGLRPHFDILGNPIKDNPDLGAIEIQQ
jgi:hypothetical protein